MRLLRTLREALSTGAGRGRSRQCRHLMQALLAPRKNCSKEHSGDKKKEKKKEEKKKKTLLFTIKTKSTCARSLPVAPCALRFRAAGRGDRHSIVDLARAPTALCKRMNEKCVGYGTVARGGKQGEESAGGAAIYGAPPE